MSTRHTDECTCDACAVEVRRAIALYDHAASGDVIRRIKELARRRRARVGAA